jgi:ATP phosphoribosyltransferase
MSDVLLAVPSKGRLEQATRETLAEFGLVITRPGGDRSYLGAIEGLDGVTVRFISASEIARELVRGRIDIGVTGLDVLHEAAPAAPDQVITAKPLGFGHADVVVAVPASWIDVETMSDLADVASDFRHRHGRWLRVATKFVNLTRRFFADHGIAEYRIVESLGSTEAAPSAGAADLIVDITSTGSTLKANGLRVPSDGLILPSQASLIVSRQSQWDDPRRAIVQAFLDKVEQGLGASVAAELR